MKNELHSGTEENVSAGQSYGFEMVHKMKINSLESGEKFLIIGGVGIIIGVDWDSIIDINFSENSKIQALNINWSINIPSPK